MEAQLVAEPEKTSPVEDEAANAGAPVLSFLKKAQLRPMFSEMSVHHQDK